MNAATIHRIRTVALFALLIVGASTRPAAAQVAGIPVGSVAPQAGVVTLDGRPTSLAQLADGKPMVLEFWATWCPLCKELEPAMEAAKKAYGDRMTFVGVGVPQNQSPERQRAYVEKAGLRGTFVFDRDQEALKAFQVPHTSYVVVLDAAGTVVYTGQGGQQDLDAAVSAALAR